MSFRTYMRYSFSWLVVSIGEALIWLFMCYYGFLNRHHQQCFFAITLTELGLLVAVIGYQAVSPLSLLVLPAVVLLTLVGTRAYFSAALSANS